MATSLTPYGLLSRVDFTAPWLPSVSAVVMDGGVGVLLARRADNGMWVVPTDWLGLGEDPAVAAHRQVIASTGLEAEVVRIVAVDVTVRSTGNDGSVAQCLDVCLLMRRTGGSAHVIDDANILDVAWFPLAALPHNLSEWSARCIDRAVGQRRRALSHHR